MENFSDRNHKIVDGVKKFFKGIHKWIKTNTRMAIIVLVALLICVAAIAYVRIFVSNESDETTQVVETAQEVLGDEEVQINEVVEVPLEQDVYPEVNQFFSAYFAALADGDKDTVSASMTVLEDLEWLKLEKKSEFVEAYQNLECYTKPGPYADTFVCYVYYEVKFYDLEVVVPGLSTMYLAKDGERYVIELSGVEEEEEEYLITISKQEDVLDLFRKVQVAYNDLVASDVAVELFLTDFPDMLKVEVAKDLSLMNVEEEVIEEAVEETIEEIVEEAVEEESAEEPVRATTKVNVRMSDSIESDRVGQVQSGDELVRLEEMNNGWSRIIFDDQEAYIKSEYLEPLNAVAHEPGVATDGTTVTTTDNVNVREEASLNSEALGAALAGESFELIEHLDNGWSKIKFNDGEAYIKSEYLE